MCMASVGTMCAEDVLQVVPFETKAGATVDDGLSFSVAMNNASAEIWALQFDLLLPEGMTIDDVSGWDPFELSTDRFPHTTDVAVPSLGTIRCTMTCWKAVGIVSLYLPRRPNVSSVTVVNCLRCIT